MAARIVRQLRHGQITIPKEFRDALGLEPDDMLRLTLNGNRLEIEPVDTTPKTEGSPWARELYEAFAPVRESLKGYSEQEINDAIDAAVARVRARARSRSA